MQPQKIVSRDEWLIARKAHLKNEKALTRMRDLTASLSISISRPKGATSLIMDWVKRHDDYDAPENVDRCCHAGAGGSPASKT